MTKKDKIEARIKELNAIRAIHHKNYEEFEKRYKNKEISKEDFEKHKISYDKKREKIRSKVHKLEEKLEQIRKNPER